jgi:hypothetical protein
MEAYLSKQQVKRKKTDDPLRKQGLSHMLFLALRSNSGAFRFPEIKSDPEPSQVAVL